MEIQNIKIFLNVKLKIMWAFLLTHLITTSTSGLMATIISEL